jgi:outer membrane protein
LKAYVLRAESEVEQNEAKITEASKQVENAKIYFNFLLNKPANDTIEAATDLTSELTEAEQLIVTPADVKNRDELKALNTAIKINQDFLKLQQNQWTPKLSGFLDLGTQTEDFKFTSKSDYYFTGLQLDIPIFKGGRNAYRIKKASLDLKNAQLNQDWISKQLSVAAQSAKNSYQSVAQNVKSLKKQLEAAESYQKLIEKVYKEGLNTFIEDVDARDQLTSAQLAVKINQYQLLMAAAIFEREIAYNNTNP